MGFKYFPVSALKSNKDKKTSLLILTMEVGLGERNPRVHNWKVGCKFKLFCGSSCKCLTKKDDRSIDGFTGKTKQYRSIMSKISEFSLY